MLRVHQKRLGKQVTNWERWLLIMKPWNRKASEREDGSPPSSEPKIILEICPRKPLGTKKQVSATWNTIWIRHWVRGGFPASAVISFHFHHLLLCCQSRLLINYADRPPLPHVFLLLLCDLLVFFHNLHIYTYIYPSSGHHWTSSDIIN